MFCSIRKDQVENHALPTKDIRSNIGRMQAAVPLSPPHNYKEGLPRDVSHHNTASSCYSFDTVGLAVTASISSPWSILCIAIFVVTFSWADICWFFDHRALFIDGRWFRCAYRAAKRMVPLGVPQKLLGNHTLLLRTHFPYRPAARPWSLEWAGDIAFFVCPQVRLVHEAIRVLGHRLQPHRLPWLACKAHGALVKVSRSWAYWHEHVHVNPRGHEIIQESSPYLISYFLQVFSSPT